MRLGGVAAVLIALAISTPPRAMADPAPSPADQARALSDAAFLKINDAREFEGASDMFLRAYELSKELSHLLNAAIALRKANLPHQAAATYRRYLDEAGPAVAPDLQARILADIDVVVRDSASVRVTTGGAPAKIELDRRVAGTASAAAPLVVLVPTEAGRHHTLRAVRAGQRAAVHVLDELTPAQALEVTLEPTPIPTTGKVAITTVPAAAQLAFVGGLAIGVAPQTLELAPGRHEVVATLRGYEPQREPIIVRAGDVLAVDLQLSKVRPTWWGKHGTKVVIAGAVVLVATGILLGPTIRSEFEPDGLKIHYPDN